jgi:uroporphyrin-III C-methyltransferase/precorrin-2 dehydrogenase/sirohydrochlorin ferrochelatase
LFSKQIGPERMRYLPLFRDINGRDCLVVGGGAIAFRKIRLLRRAGGRVTVIAPSLTDKLMAFGETDKIDFILRPFEADDVAGRVLVVAATGDRAVNAAVSAAARNIGVPVNVVDDAALSDVVMPAIVDRNPLIVAISSGGAAPVLARNIRAAIEAMLPANLGQLAETARALRDNVRQRITDPVKRLRFWERYFLGWRGGSRGSAGNAGSAIEEFGRSANDGQVAIVGAGPGDPDLLTLKALHRLQDADVIIHDRLVGPAILDYARRDADLIDVGKTPGRHSHSQDEINALLAHHAGQGKRVVRLKGGDPFIFGRGGEEQAYLKARGFRVEIVPGITAALGCASAGGIPLTHRGTAQAVTLLTGTAGGNLPDLDWKAIAATRATLAVYMGVGTAGALRDNLIAAGADPATPVAIIENGTLESERITTGRLDELAALVESNAVRAPALLIIGEVVAVAAEAVGSTPADLALVS